MILREIPALITQLSLYVKEHIGTNLNCSSERQTSKIANSI